MSNILKTTDITSIAAMPIKKGTLDFLFNELADMRKVLIQSMAYNTQTAYILYGLKPTIAGTSYSFSEGYVYYDSKIYFVPAATITVSGSNIPVFKTNITSYTTNADPVLFSDGNTYNVHEIHNATISADVTGSGFLDWANVKYWNLDWTSIVDAAISVDAAWAIRQGYLVFKGYFKKCTASLTPYYSIIGLPSYARPMQECMRKVFVSNVGGVDAKFYEAGFRLRFKTDGSVECMDMNADGAGTAISTGMPLNSGLDNACRIDMTSIIPIPVF